MSATAEPVTSDAPIRAVDLARRYLDTSDLDGAWFALGGSSLDAARLVSALDQELGVTLSLRDLLCATSVRDCLTAAQQHVPQHAEPAAEAPAGVPTATAGTAGSPVDLLWPALVVLPADERLKLAHQLLGSVVQRGLR
jgi:acyl carrier protein